MAARQLLLISSSRCNGFDLLEHVEKDIRTLLNKNNVKTVLFLPYAQKDYDEYTKNMEKPFKKWGYQLTGIHMANDPIQAIETAEIIFIGGGNTFVLLKTLYEKNLIEPIRKQILDKGIPYIGSSAGTNVATKSIHTTNDMPAIYPPTFDGLNLVPFNINPHYLETDPKTKHKGETRDQRINEVLDYHQSMSIVGLREGTSLVVDGYKMTLHGFFNAKLFQKNKEPIEFSPGSDLSFLL